MHLALQQILNCPYKGLTKQIYLESKVLELIALRLEQAIEDNQTQKQSVRLRSDDIERIHHAKDILLCNSNNPPSLVALARQVGLNDCMLKKVFVRSLALLCLGIYTSIECSRHDNCC